MKFRIPVSVLLLFLIFGINNLFGGEIAPELAAKISGSSGDNKIPVIIQIQKPLYKTSLKNDLIGNYKTAASRHRAGMERLKSYALSTQVGLLDALYRLQTDGLADNIKSRWIINGVTAEISPSEIETIAARPDVAFVYAQPEIKLIESGESISASSQLLPSAPEPNLHMVGADSAWALGYNGAGRIVCSFDTGVEGIHPSLYDKWKGHDGDTSAAWYDPIHQTPFPDDTEEHGTHTMGIMVGAGEDMQFQKDSIGVAPGAKWIAAAVINILGVSIFDAFEWAADPDGDPNTISDVPDVINHSWGYEYLGCNDYFREMIENTEALGIVNIFAAGNSGSDPGTIVNPANGAYDSLDCFAVGSIYHGDSVVSEYSSRGPSDCNPMSIEMIKPNLVAPGDSIWSSTGSVYISRRNGTSMAAPHVSGAVAILRQYAPDATVDEIKQALIAGAARPPVGEPYPNNDYGWGMLYIPSAMEALDSIIHPPTADLRVYSFDYPQTAPGGTVEGTVILSNIGSAIDSVVVNITGSGGGLDLLVNTLQFGTILSGDTAHSDVPMQVMVHDTVTAGRMLTIDIEITGGGGYSRTAHLYVRVGTAPEISFYTHTNDVLDFTISNFGEYGFGFNSFYPLSYSGFRYIDKVRNDLFEAAFIIGTDSAHISDGIRNVAEEPDNDFAVAPGGDMLVSVPGTKADQQTYSKFDDSKAENPIGLEIIQKTYSWNDPPADNFVIMQYIIKNISDSTINDIYAGLFFDWDLNNSLIDSARYFLAENLGSIHHQQVGGFTPTPAKYRAVGILNHEGMSGHGIIERTTIKDLSFEDSVKYNALITLSYDSTVNFWYDVAHVVGTGPFSLAPGAIDTAVFAVVAADTTLDNLIAAAVEARSMYDIVTDVELVEDDILPVAFELDQNYPNPFNPTTAIRFSLAERARVELSVYNLLGRRVVSLIDEELPAGDYKTKWDGRDSDGNGVAGGVYFYRLKAGERNLTRKMVLLK